jgi:lipopolysaccharide/colanic/teichoic acid biosynthesis glycosyltransferase
MSALEFFQLTNFNISNYFYTQSKAFYAFNVDEFASNAFARLVALLMLILLSPFLIIVGIAIKVTTGGDIFYKQVRVGKDGKEFEIYKFTSMIANAEAQTGAVLATKNDDRVTPIGKILRKSHVDELPQLINVLKGEMSFIGPRPERPVFVNEYDKTIPYYKRRKEVRPGITGLAQICLPYDATARQKIIFDNFYIDNKESVLFNLLIAYYTVKKMIFFRHFNGLYQYN